MGVNKKWSASLTRVTSAAPANSRAVKTPPKPPPRITIFAFDIGRDSTPNLAAKRHKKHKKEQAPLPDLFFSARSNFCAFCAFCGEKPLHLCVLGGSCYSDAAF